MPLWQSALICFGCALAGAAGPLALAWRQDALIAHLRDKLLAAERDANRMRRELFHSSKTRVLPWPWPPPLPDGDETQ